jgi:hypothetical protein
MQQVQKVKDYCTRRENCPKSRRRVGQHVKCFFSTIEQKKNEKNNDKQQFSPVPGVPSLVSRRKMTLKLNYIYMKVL